MKSNIGIKKYRKVARDVVNGMIGMGDLMYRIPTKLRVLKEIRRLLNKEIFEIESKIDKSSKK